MFDAIAGLLDFFFGVWPSYGGAITLLTLALMLALSPLQIKGQRSMMKMQELAPEMKRIQDKYKDDREAMNRELMAFYQENKINPLGGCLPLLIQMPVFIVLFQVLRGLSRVTDEGPDPRYLSADSELRAAIEGDGGELPSFGLDLARAANEVFAESIVSALPYILLISVTAFTGWYQQQQAMARRNPNQATVNPQQQAIMKWLPIMLPIFSFWFPAGVTLYIVVSNVFRVGQQTYINKTMGLPLVPEIRFGRADDAGKGGGSRAKSGSRAKGSPKKAAKKSAAKKKGGRKGGGSGGPAGRQDASGPATPPPRPRKKKRR